TRYASDIREVHLTLSSENYRHTAEIALKVNGREYLGRETANTARTAITEAIGRLEHQVRRLKELRLERRRGDRTRTADATAQPGEAPGGDGEALGGAAWEE